MHQDTIPKVSNRVLWQDHKPLEDKPAMLTTEESAAAAIAALQIYAGKTDGEQDILQAGICHNKESMSCWIFVQLQAQARVRELHRDLQAKEIQAKQEKKEKKKQKKAAEQQNSEPTVAVKAADMDPEQENHQEQTEVVPPPAKKLKRSQAVSYASADIEAFFQSATTTAPDVQNPGIKFVTVCHFKCIWHIQSCLINKFDCQVLEKLKGLGTITVPSGLLEKNKKSFTVPAPPHLQSSNCKSIEIKFWPYLRAF